MTALCPGGGPSQVIPGTPTNFYLSGGALALLASKSGLVWLAEVLGYVAGVNFILPDICSTDPPADPGITTQDIYCLFAPGQPGCDTGTSLKKIQDAIIRANWLNWCECVTPPAGAVSTPVAPSPVPTINPPTIVGTSGPFLCGDKTVSGLGPPLAGTTVVYNDTMFDGVASGADPSTTFHWKPLPTPTPTAVEIITTAGSDGANPQNMNFAIYGWRSDLNTSFLLVPNITVPFGFGRTTTIISLPSYMTGIGYAYANAGTGTPTQHFSVETKWYCPGGGAGGVNTLNCCPLPLDVQSAINDIHTLVTYLQRYMLPFAYITGAAHSGISGSGSFAVSRLIGVKTHITTVPGYVGEIVANPNIQFDLGWISISDIAGGIHERKIKFLDDIWLPRHMAEATTFGYYLNPGVVATFTELEAEP